MEGYAEKFGEDAGEWFMTGYLHDIDFEKHPTLHPGESLKWFKEWGYPEGLVGNTIPLSARLMAVADVYDALISERVYKPAYSHEQAVEIIRDGRGSHFDPDMVDAFLTLSEEFRRIAQQFADAEPARLAEVDRLAADLPMERIELTSREEPL